MRAPSTVDFSMLLSLDPDRMPARPHGVGRRRSGAGAKRHEPRRPHRAPSPRRGHAAHHPVITSGRLKEAGTSSASSSGSARRLAGAPLGHRGGSSRCAELRLAGRFDGAPTALTPVFLRPGANALQVKARGRRPDGRARQELSSGRPLVHRVRHDAIRHRSIQEVVKTLFEALLARDAGGVPVLQSWRATLIPVVAVPVSVNRRVLRHAGARILGQPAHVVRPGCSRSGIVVDDAIVVIENVERIMAQNRVPPAVAADRAMHQVSRALISIVLVLCSVFIRCILGGHHRPDVQAVRDQPSRFPWCLSGIVALHP